MKATFNFSAWQSLTQFVFILGYTVYELIIENAIPGLIPNKREWNNCFIEFLKLQNFESAKCERKKREKLSEVEKT